MTMINHCDAKNIHIELNNNVNELENITSLLMLMCR